MPSRRFWGELLCLAAIGLVLWLARRWYEPDPPSDGEARTVCYRHPPFRTQLAWGGVLLAAGLLVWGLVSTPLRQLASWNGLMLILVLVAIGASLTVLALDSSHRSVSIDDDGIRGTSAWRAPVALGWSEVGRLDHSRRWDAYLVRDQEGRRTVFIPESLGGVNDLLWGIARRLRFEQYGHTWRQLGTRVDCLGCEMDRVLGLREAGSTAVLREWEAVLSTLAVTLPVAFERGLAALMVSEGCAEARRLPQALEAIGAPESAEVARRFVALLPEDDPSGDLEEHRRALRQAATVHVLELLELDKVLATCDGDIDDLLRRYLRRAVAR